MNRLANRETPELAGDGRGLLACLQALGTKRSNPVLDLLGPTEHIEAVVKYPEIPLRFGETNWRAFYHCHAYPHRSEDEHGHFHVFAQISSQDRSLADWAHVVALAVDRFGQPLRWVAVNRWVTGGGWRTAHTLAQRLTKIAILPGITLAERWLLLMLRVYRHEIGALLEQRDRYLTKIKGDNTVADMLEDRELYTLAERPIDLLRKLNCVLLAHEKR